MSGELTLIIRYISITLLLVSGLVLLITMMCRKKTKSVYRTFTETKGDAFWGFIRNISGYPLAVAAGCVIYFIPAWAGLEADFLPLSITAYVVILLIFIFRKRPYDAENIALPSIMDSDRLGFVSVDRKGRLCSCTPLIKRMFPGFRGMQPGSDVRKEYPLFATYMDGSLSHKYYGRKTFSVEVKRITGGLMNRYMGLTVWFRDVTAEEKLSANNKMLKNEVGKLDYLYRHDQMTKIYNRVAFNETMADFSDEDNLENLTVAVIDINGLKYVNDTYGHAAGDELIEEASNVLDSVFGRYGKVFRTGGDEFAAIFTDPNLNIRSLYNELNEAAARWQGKSVPTMSFAVGFASGKNYKGYTAEELLSAADDRMYEDKEKYYEKTGLSRRTNGR